MDYFSETLTMKLLKNFIMNDPICDYFEIMNGKEYCRDGNSIYKDYIIKESEIFKNKLINKIIEKSKINDTSINSIKRTKHKIVNNYPLITNAKLHNKEYNIEFFSI